MLVYIDVVVLVGGPELFVIIAAICLRACFGSRHPKDRTRSSVCGGIMDVTANEDEDSASERPVENMYWQDPPPGRYEFWVQNNDDRNEDVFTVRLSFAAVLWLGCQLDDASLACDFLAQSCYIGQSCRIIPFESPWVMKLFSNSALTTPVPSMRSFQSMYYTFPRLIPGERNRSRSRSQ